MQIIRELSKIITPKRTKHINLLSFNLKSDSKLMQLYEGVRQNKFQSDEDAIIGLYGSLKHKYKYSKLKYDLRRRLYNTLHLVELDAKTFGADVKAVLECQKAWTAIRFLIFLGAIKSAVSILEKHFPKMLKYEFTVMVVEGARLLKKYYSTHTLDAKKLTYYNRLTLGYLSLYVAEVNIDGYYNHLLSMYIENKSFKEGVAAMATKYLKKVDAIYPDVLSSSFVTKYKQIEIIKYTSQYNYKGAMEICNEAIEILEKRIVKRKFHLMLIYSQAIGCHLQLEQYKIAEIKCDRVLERYLEDGEFNWFKTKELQLQNAIYSEQYQKAQNVYIECATHKKFSKLPASFREEWIIYRAFLEILNIIELIDSDDSNESSKCFRLNKFLNEVPVFSKDKKGKNTTILVAQTTLLILQGKYDRIIGKMEAIEKYINRHLDYDYHHRTIFFLKIIKELVKAGFDNRMVNWEKIKILKNELSQTPLDIINPNYDLEIIRYEKLVDIIIHFIRTDK